jgi:hypothetical protein
MANLRVLETLAYESLITLSPVNHSPFCRQFAFSYIKFYIKVEIAVNCRFGVFGIIPANRTINADF